MRINLAMKVKILYSLTTIYPVACLGTVVPKGFLAESAYFSSRT